VPFDETYRDASYDWLQDPEMRRLTMSTAMTREQQAEWYAGLTDRTDYMVWGVEYDGRPAGVMGLKHLDAGDGGAEYFLYVGDRALWGQGIARWATDEIVAEGRRLGRTYLYGLVGTHNDRSRDVHEHLGFKVVGEQDGRWRMVYEL
jgi:RimJ/RimL family protein N-acetyltransferase